MSELGVVTSRFKHLVVGVLAAASGVLCEVLSAPGVAAAHLGWVPLVLTAASWVRSELAPKGTP